MSNISLTAGFRGVSAALLLVLMVLSGCVSYREILPGTHESPLPVYTVTPSEHALSILGIDFDPPLDDPQILQQGITLLVVVENQGLVDEENVGITVRLTEAGAQPEPLELLNETVVLRSLPAGKMQTVAFPQLSVLPPRRERYQLEINLEPVPGEQDTFDNLRTYEIVVQGEEPAHLE